MAKIDIELFTKDEVIQILRLDKKGVKDPGESLRYLVRTGQLQCLKVAGQRLFTERAIKNYLAYCADKGRR